MELLRATRYRKPGYYTVRLLVTRGGKQHVYRCDGRRWYRWPLDLASDFRAPYPCGRRESRRLERMLLAWVRTGKTLESVIQAVAR